MRAPINLTTSKSSFFGLIVLLAITPSLRGDEIPRPEHPTPDAIRAHWSNLNGPWQFRFDPADEGLKLGWHKPSVEGFDQTIIVPFPWESRLSTIHKPEYQGVAWYRREISVPATFPSDQRVWLRFGAVDWEAQVWVNGEPVAKHEGGYTPFEVDITDVIKARGPKPSVVVVRVFDPTDPSLPTGKQVGWYTRTSGIWQTVWLESRPAGRIASWTVKTDIDPKKATFNVEFAGLAFVDQIEQGRKRTAQTDAATATVADVEYTMQFRIELVLIVEVGRLPVDRMPGRCFQTAFAYCHGGLA